MLYVLALAPLLAVLGLMVGWRWGAHQAGPVGWLAALVVGLGFFGLAPPVFWVSQAKGLLLSGFVLAVMWPALLLYHWIDQNGGIMAVARWLEEVMPNRGMCLILLAWALSGLLEGLAGFGLPIAVVAPMLVALGIAPVTAVAAVAVGHSWSVTFGDMGVIYQTLIAVTGLDGAALVPWAAGLLGCACLACGLATARLLGELRHWPAITGLAVVMAAAQYLLAAAGLIPLAGFGAGLAGLAVYGGAAWLARRRQGNRGWPPDPTKEPPPRAGTADTAQAPGVQAKRNRRPMVLALATYGGLALLMAFITLTPSVRAWTLRFVWQPAFPEVRTDIGFTVRASPGPAFRPWSHPGSLILGVACASILLGPGARGARRAACRKAAQATWRSGAPATVGIVSLVGLATLMDHCGLTLLLAQGLSHALGKAFPLVSPLVGILGAFATGSNNNSNVLFGSLQQRAAQLLQISPLILVAAQTAGGSLGSMLAPAKLVVGCGTVGLQGQEGLVLRRTLLYGLLIGLGLGLLTLISALAFSPPQAPTSWKHAAYVQPEDRPGRGHSLSAGPVHQNDGGPVLEPRPAADRTGRFLQAGLLGQHGRGLEHVSRQQHPAGFDLGAGVGGAAG